MHCTNLQISIVLLVCSKGGYQEEGTYDGYTPRIRPGRGRAFVGYAGDD